MRSKLVQRLLRGLIALLGAGVGAGVAAALVRLLAWAAPEMRLSVGVLVAAYTVACAVMALLFFLLSPHIIRLCVDWGSRVEQRLERMSFSQVVASMAGLTVGLVIAALMCQVLSFVGSSLFTTAVSAIFYVVLGTLGFSVGLKRAPDLAEMQERLGDFRERRAQRKTARHARGGEEESPARPKVLDASALIDGRVYGVARTGFLEGELVVPRFVLEELRRIAGSADPQRRSRGRRGLELVEKLQNLPGVAVRVDASDWPEEAGAEVKLLRLARELGGRVVTNDHSLCKVAALSGLAALNLNDLSAALRPALMAGESVTLRITKEGKEPGQGVGYLEDGTMIVVEGGRACLGETVEAVVTSVLQTNAGRMIFARAKESAPA